jgi:NACHT domain- and WD repeat-containing protein
MFEQFFSFDREHIAPVLSVAATSGLVASSGEDSTVIVAHISNGEVKGRIDHHRGPVTSLAITSSGDVLISGKQHFALYFR